MRYLVTVSGRTLEVDLSEADTVVEGKSVSIDMAGSPASNRRHLLVDGVGYDLIARPGGRSGIWELTLEGRTYRVEVADERSRRLEELVGATSTHVERTIRAPMPGLVVRLLVAPGEVVVQGQPVAVVEAMKMENELKSPAAGTIARIEVEPGQVVEKDTLLIVLE